MNSGRWGSRGGMEARNLADLYDLPVIDWAGVESRLGLGVSQAPGSGGPDRHTCWLATINRDGTPHVTGVGALWVDGAFWFETGETTRKGRNLARDVRCTLSLATAEFDLIVEDEAAKITDRLAVERRYAVWAAWRWPTRVDETDEALTADFSAPSAGPPTWHV